MGEIVGARRSAHMPFRVSFPRAGVAERGKELVDVTFADGRAERIGLHDYQRIYAVAGLYEEIVQRRLECRSPEQVANMLSAVVHERGWRPEQARVLDLGAGNGVSGEALARHGLRPVVAIDILSEAQTAAQRDRPDLYDLYVVGDPLALAASDRQAILDRGLTALTCVGAVGGGHVPVASFAAVLTLLSSEAYIAYTVNLASRDRETDELRALIGDLERRGRLRQLTRQPYQHRLTTTGKPLIWEAVVAQWLPAGRT